MAWLYGGGRRSFSRRMKVEFYGHVRQYQNVKNEIDAIVARLRPAGPPSRWVPGNNMHLTLKFLDEITETQVAPLREAIARAARLARLRDFSSHALSPVVS